MNTMQDQTTLSTLGDYTLLAKLGEGPLGDSYLAEHRSTKKRAALKILPKELCADTAFIANLEKKTARLAQLEHPHIVKTEPLGHASGKYFLISDAILNAENESMHLGQYLASKEEPLSEEEILSICKQIASALDFAHQKKDGDAIIVHQGLKLSNILVGKDHVYVADFALPRAFHSRYLQSPQFFKSMMQTWAFLAPEQKAADSPVKADLRSDNYAFGVLVYYLIMQKFPEGVFVYPSEARKDLHINWDFLISSCLQNDPAKRPVLLMDLFDFSKKEQPKPLINPQEISRPEYDADPAAIFQIDNVVAKYTPKRQEIKTVDPLLTDMIVIEGGTFFRGSNNGGRDEMPRHAVNISSFAFDIHPVTNEQFVRFLDAMGGEKDSNNNDIIKLRDSRIKRVAGKLCIESGYSKHPIVGVTWYGAIAYSKWVGKRLPTEAEWEIAACGCLDGAQYPTGDEIERSQANYFSSDTTAVMSYPPNAYGLYDMAGNVYEWCNDWYSYNYYDLSIQEPDNPKGPLQGVYRVLRGGCWKSLKEDLRCAHRHRNNPGSMNRTCGFRCAADVS